jgi:hypothetical protein
MSWLFSRALVAEYSAGICSGGEPCAPSSGSPIPQAYLPSDRMMAFSRPSRFGMTFAPLTDTLGAGLLTWFRAVSRARTSVLPAKERASTASAPACGEAWRASWAKFDPVSSSWKTAQPSLLGDSDECSVTWPRSGMTADGQCWELTKLAPPISATGSGLLPSIPTPTAKDSANARNATANRRPGAKFNSGTTLCDFVTLWPTAKSSDHRIGMPERYKGEQSLNGRRSNLNDAAARWPTPDAHMGSGGRTSKTAPTGKRASGTKQQITLNDAVKWNCATPTARDWRSGKASEATHAKNSRPLSEQIGGSLNPMWVEWLMGWPLGWTDLKPWGMVRFLSAPQPLGDCSPAHRNEAPEFHTKIRG